MLLTKNRKILILAWSLNFFTLCLTKNVLFLHEGFYELNPIMGYFLHTGNGFIAHFVIWGFVFVFYGIYFERFLRNKKYENYYKVTYIMLFAFLLNAINDLIYFLIANGVI